jgi:hypothetical protein
MIQTPHVLLRVDHVDSSQYKEEKHLLGRAILHFFDMFLFVLREGRIGAALAAVIYSGSS